MNSTKEKSFIEVFPKIDFSTELKNTFRHIRVNKIQRFSEQSLIKIYAFSNILLNELNIKKGLKFVEDGYDNQYNIELELQYLYEDSFSSVFNEYYENYLNTLNQKSPVSAIILRNSKMNVNDEKKRVELFVENDKLFLLKNKNIDTELNNIIEKRFNQSYKVRFKPLSLEKTVNSKKWNKEKISEEKVIMEYKPKTTQPKEKKSFGGRKKIKVKKDMEITGFIRDSIVQEEEIVIAGSVLNVEDRDTKSGKKLLIFDLYDGTSAVTIKIFSTPEFYEDNLKNLVKKGNGVIVGGKVIYDNFSNELTVMASEIDAHEIVRTVRVDNRAEKRVELHCHTKMSKMDGIASSKDLINRAKEYGHKALAITDHGVVQAFPDACDAAEKAGVKLLYGVETYIVDDLETIVKNSKNQNINSEYVIFDIETTGFHNRTCKIIEIGAVKFSNGEVTDKFSALINPLEKLPQEIIELTKITDDMLENEPTIDVVLPKFIEFIQGTTLVAHNANFDVNFINKNYKDLFNEDLDLSYIDTVTMSQLLITKIKNYKLNTISAFLGISLDNHHRAVDDAEACASIFKYLLEEIDKLNKDNENDINIQTFDELNNYACNFLDKKRLRSSHAIIFAKNYTGLRNLYELISKAHIDYFYRTPRIPKSVLNEFREGLILGSACEAGELYKAILENRPFNTYKPILDYYDYYEVQPLGNNQFLIDNGVCTETELIEINKEIIELGDRQKKLVVATGDVHFLDKEDNIYRSIILDAEKFKDADRFIPLYYRTTEEMLEEFSYLDEEKAFEIVVTNTNKVADLCEDILPVPKGTFPPLMPKADEELTEIVYNKAHKVYGNPLPEIVEKRIKRELDSIIKNGFSVMYIIAQKLVWKSLEDGYLVGSRGSVGSSFVATMSDITEVNPLQPHYFCEKCQYTDFDSDIVKEYLGTSGCDMPDKKCPNCETMLKKDGHDIPFETFLGFDGDKEPDIDLNFSGEYQARAHAYTEELFGTGFVFKAGTIGTLADKTAFAYVAKYFEKREKPTRNAEISVFKDKLTGIRKSSGQHPGGLMVVPSDNSIFNFCPVQRPANDMKSNVVTTHFDYHSISGRLLKLDILGHDVPTILRRLQDLTNVDPTTIDIGDKKIMKLFVSPEPMGVTCDDIKCNTGSLGLPEFGTNFVRKMVLDTKPSTFSELVRISGLSHGTDVWLNNGQDLVNNGIATLKEIIPTRDDIMVYLILHGVDNLESFVIMEGVRKGKGLKPEQEETMRKHGVPEWYIDSCKKIKYMFPKGHAVAYVMMTVRIAFYKLYYPEAFYTATLSEKYDDVDYATMCTGKEQALKTMESLRALGNDMSKTDADKITALELIYEMYARDIEFMPIDIYKALPTKFLLLDGKLMPPLCTISGLGENAGETLVQAREEAEFETIDDFRERTKISKTVIDNMKELGLFNGIPESKQVSLFEM